MVPWALALYALYLALAFGGRTLVQLRSTGSTGFKGISGRPLSAEWSGGVLFVAAVLLGLAAPVLDLAGTLEPVAVLDGSAGHALGFVLFFAGLAGTLLAQAAMGASWRIGVDATERTELVTAGPFALVRNPIFSAMIPAFLGLALLVPNAAALAGFAALVVAVEVQVRLVEEPHLTKSHGERYLRYASRVGRFVPGAGLLAVQDALCGLQELPLGVESLRVEKGRLRRPPTWGRARWPPGYRCHWASGASAKRLRHSRGANRAANLYDIPL